MARSLRACLRPNFPFSRDTGHIGVESTLLQYDFILINDVDSALISKGSRVLSYQGLRLQRMNLGGTPFHP